MGTSTALKYRAFLSYAHADRWWGERIHRWLERFTIDADLVGRPTPHGPVPRSLRPIFRDREDFSAGQLLSDATLAALDASAALIVLCSNVAATRPAVNEEVRLFRLHHPDRPVIPLVIGGVYPENLPLALRYSVLRDGTLGDQPDAILGPDLRGDGDGWSLGLAKLVAGLIGVSTDEIVRRAERERRRRIRKWIAGLVGVMAALLCLTAWAEFNRWDAIAQRGAADEQRRIAIENEARAVGQRDRALIVQSRFLVGLANQSFLSSDYVTAGLLALEALPSLPSASEDQQPDRPFLPKAELTLFAALALQQERAVLMGHSTSLTDVDVSPDGEIVATSGNDGTVRLWSKVGIALGSPIMSAAVPANCVAFSKDGTRIIGGYKDGTIVIFDRKTLSVAKFSVSDADVFDIKPGLDNDSIVVAALSTVGQVKVVTLSDGAVTRSLKVPVDNIYAVDLSPDGKSIATGGKDRTAKIVDLETGEVRQILNSHTGAVTKIVYSRDGQLLLSTSVDGTAIVWDARNGEKLKSLGEMGGPVLDAAFIANGRGAATVSSDNTIRIWNIDTARAVMELRGHCPAGSMEPPYTTNVPPVLTRGCRTVAIAINPLSNELITAASDGTARIWSLGQSHTLGILEGKPKFLESAEFSPDGSRVAASSPTHGLWLWDTTNHKIVIHLPDISTEIHAQSFTASSGLVVGKKTGEVVWLDSSSGSEFRRFEGLPGPIRSAVADAAGRWIGAVANTGGVAVWDAATGQRIFMLESASEQEGGNMAFSSDGNKFAYSTPKGGVHIHSTVDGAQLAMLRGDGFKDITFALNDRRLVTGSDDGIARLWRADTGEFVAELAKEQDARPALTVRRHRMNERSQTEHLVRMLSLSPGPAKRAVSSTGRLVLTVSRTDRVDVWDANTGTFLHGFASPGSHKIWDARLMNAETRIVAARADGSVIIWDLKSGEAVGFYMPSPKDAVALALNRTDETVFVGSWDDAARILDAFATTRDIVRFARRALPRCLTEDQLEQSFLDRAVPIWCAGDQERGAKWPVGAARQRPIGEDFDSKIRIRPK